MKNTLIIFFLALLMSGCSSSSSQKWYKTGCNQDDFNFDSMDCKRSAEEIARQATLTGNGIDYDVFENSYLNCITSKGWSHRHPESEPNKNIVPIKLVSIHENTLEIFGCQINMPESFNLTKNQISSNGSIRRQTLFFQAQGPVYLTLIIQESLSPKFIPTDYPVKSTFVTYSKAQEKNHKIRN